jgi:hypothetical protein
MLCVVSIAIAPKREQIAIVCELRVGSLACGIDRLERLLEQRIDIG